MSAFFSPWLFCKWEMKWHANMVAIALTTAFLTAVVFGVSSGGKVAPPDKEQSPVANRPKVSGKLLLHLRERHEEAKGSGKIKVVERSVEWQVAETAIIVCDMWDDHHCKIAAQRVGVMAPRMNQVLTAARDRGVVVIHAPSETMNIYAGTPYRQRMEQAKPAVPPVPIAKRCDRNASSEPPTLPVDTTLDCDDCQLGPVVRRHTRQHAGLDIIVSTASAATWPGFSTTASRRDQKLF